MAIDAGYTIRAISGRNGSDGQNGTNGKDGKDGTDGNGITVQYSVNGTTNWHSTFTSGDIYMQQSTDGGKTWSAAMRIVGEKGDKGEDGVTPPVYTCELSMKSIGSTVTVNVYKDGAKVTEKLYYSDFYGTGSNAAETAGVSKKEFSNGTATIAAVTNATKHLVKIYSDSNAANLLCTGFCSYGNTGAASTSYWLITDVSNIKKDTGGNFTPSKINLTAKYKSGNGSPANYSGRFKIECSTNGTTFPSTAAYTSQQNEAAVQFDVPADTKLIRCSLYLKDGTSTLLDQDIITVTNDGEKGNKGDKGDKGDPGTAGLGVSSILAYTALSTNSTKPAESAFTTSVKSLSATNKYLWRYEVTTFTDGSTTGSYADATVIAVWGTDGEDAVSVSLSSDTVDVLCGAGTGTFLGQQTKTVTVHATKGNAKIASTITVPAASGGVTISKTNGTASADGSVMLTFSNGGNLGGSATKTANRTITVVADGLSFNFNITISKISNGAYLGRCSAVPGSTNTITVYTHATTLLGSSSTRYALKGDYISIVAGTYIGKIYQYNGSSWVQDTNTGH